MLVALAAGEETQAATEDKQATKKVDDDQTAAGTVKTKRGLHSFGDYGWQPSHDHHFGGSEHHEHHQHIKTITIEKKIPVPYTVHKHVPYTVEKKVSESDKVDEFQNGKDNDQFWPIRCLMR